MSSTGTISGNRRIAVLGGGLLGCCIALELSRRGAGVDLFERDSCLMNRTSLRNEGKIHLGLVYANDLSLETGRLQLKGALHFRRYLARWIGEDANCLTLSSPFEYAVAMTLSWISISSNDITVVSTERTRR